MKAEIESISPPLEQKEVQDRMIHLLRKGNTKVSMLQNKELELMSANFDNIFEHSGSCYVILDMQARIVSCNQLAVRIAWELIKKIPKKGDEYAELLPASRKKAVKRIIKKVLLRKTKIEYEVEYPGSKWMHMKWLPITRNGRSMGACIIGTDITKKKLTEIQLVNSEKRLQTFINESLLAIYFVDPYSKKIVFANPAFIRMLGYSRVQLKALSMYNFINQSRQNIDARCVEVVKHGSLPVSEDEWVTKDGKIIHVLVTNIYQVVNGRGLNFVTAYDISESKLAKEKLRLSQIKIKNFAKHLHEVQEAERAYIAREIHDELGQQLVSIKFGLSALLKTADEKATERIKSTLENADQTLQSLRRIATSLRPGILDTLGLLPSIDWLANEFKKRTGLNCSVNRNISSLDIPCSVSTALFRICQESLTNIMKHADATEVVIDITLLNGWLSITVSDNGKGISAEALNNPFSMGLLGMHERATNAGGELKVLSAYPQGTSIRVTCPIIYTAEKAA